MTSQELAEYLVKEANVFCRPGTWYGIIAEGHFRINSSIPMDYMDEGLEKLAKGLSKL
jgi:bifunctional pyridoxal-dependent enzyme with beta-cystathionase and maltose regulon repressor activities